MILKILTIIDASAKAMLNTIKNKVPESIHATSNATRRNLETVSSELPGNTSVATETNSPLFSTEMACTVAGGGIAAMGVAGNAIANSEALLVSTTHDTLGVKLSDHTEIAGFRSVCQAWNSTKSHWIPLGITEEQFHAYYQYSSGEGYNSTTVGNLQDFLDNTAPHMTAFSKREVLNDIVLKNMREFHGNNLDTSVPDLTQKHLAHPITVFELQQHSAGHNSPKMGNDENAVLEGAFFGNEATKLSIRQTHPELAELIKKYGKE